MFSGGPQEVSTIIEPCAYTREQHARPDFRHPCNRPVCLNAAARGYQFCCATCARLARAGNEDESLCRCDEHVYHPTMPPTIAMHGRVILLTAGFKERGTEWLMDYHGHSITTAQHDEIWHRMEKVYCRHERLSDRGTYRSAQWELQTFFGRRYWAALEMTMYLIKWYLIQGITSMAHVILCSHGHHRSVAHAELSKTEAQRLFPGLEIICIHLDHRHAHWMRKYPDNSYGPLNASDEDYGNWQYFEEYIRYPYDNAAMNPPPFRMHDGLPRYRE